MELPQGFVDLSAAYNSPAGTFVNIIGSVIDIMAPSTTRTGELVFTFKLLDQRLRDATYGSDGLRVRFFSKGGLESLPKVRQHGDAVLLRAVKISPFAGQPIALSNFQTGVLVFPVGSIPDPSFVIAYQGTKRLNGLGTPLEVGKLSLTEQQYIIGLKQEMSAVISSRNKSADLSKLDLTIPTGPRAQTIGADSGNKRSAPRLEPPGQAAKRVKISSFGDKFMLVKDLQHPNFADLCVQVVKKFPSKYGCELYVTDYSKNPQMFLYKAPEDENDCDRDGDNFGYTGPPKKAWPGPYGFMVLKVEAKEPHASHANNKILEGDIVILRNVKTHVRAEGGQLDGFMWPDHTNPAQIQITKLSNKDLPEIQELLLRKEKYWEDRRRKAPPVAPPPAPSDEPPKLTNRQKKKLKRLQEREGLNIGGVGGEGRSNADSAFKAAVNPKKTTNPHIRCSNEEIPISSVSHILDHDKNLRHTNIMPDGRRYTLPFINANYRARVRVVDFEPRCLEDFAVPALMDEEKSEFSPDMDWDCSPKYHWFFSLLLQDAIVPSRPGGVTPPSMWVHVGHEEAQYLLGNDMEDPQELQNDTRLLTKLREKLFILWGDLEERGGQVLNNRPFECCIAECGVELDDDDKEKLQLPFGWKKLFRLFGTTIL